MTLQLKITSLLGSICIVLLTSPLVAQATTIVAGTSLVRFDSEGTAYSLGRSQAVGDINGDGYQDLVVGAHSNSASAIGRVYIIYGQVGNFTATTLTSTNATVLTGASVADQAGVAVAVGDLNNDSYDDILVGASKDDQSSANGGTVYVIHGQASAITSGALSTYPRFLPEAADDRLGDAVGIGDMNGDGTNEILLGASKNDDGDSNAGAIYFYWNNGATITANVSLSGVAERYGELASSGLGSLVVFEDINNDGADDVLISASGYSAIGAVYVIYGSTATINDGLSSSISSASVRFSTGSTGDNFGSGVAVGDINGDGYSELAIGAPGNSTAGSAAGIVYLLTGASANWSASSLASAITLTGKATSDAAGTAVEMTDLNNDGYAELLVAATSNSDGGTASGTIYLFTGSTTILTSGSLSSANDTVTGQTANDSFGRSMAAPDFNGDGFPELTIGAPGYNNAGALYSGYLMVDADGDGVAAASGGLLYTGSDCSDTDATVSANQTYYPDSDSDDLGDPAGTTESVCSTTPSTGFVNNAADTNATVVNHWVEIDDYGVVLHPKGKQLVLLNWLTGEVVKTVTLSKKKSYDHNSLKLLDVRKDNSMDVVVTSRQNKAVLLTLLKVKVNTGKLSTQDSLTVVSSKVAVNKTTVKKKLLQLKNSSGKVLFSFTVNKKYHFVSN